MLAPTLPYLTHTFPALSAVTHTSDLEGQTVCIQFCSISKRDVGVVLQQGETVASQQGACPAGAGGVGMQVEVLRSKLCAMLGKCLHIDEATAKFYLEDAGGDLKAAIKVGV